MRSFSVKNIIGHVSDAAVAHAIHELEHHDLVDTLVLGDQDVQRHRLRAITEGGAECLIALPRDQRLSDGAVIVLADDAAVVVRMRDVRWLALEPADTATALEIGHLAGHMHWRVRFDDSRLRVALDAPVRDYLDRLAPWIDGGRLRHDLD